MRRGPPRRRSQRATAFPDEETDMDPDDVSEVMAKPISRELLSSSIPARLAYTGLDGDPRVIPIAFLWDGSQLTGVHVAEVGEGAGPATQPPVWRS
jgi:hypothetical protein